MHKKIPKLSEADAAVPQKLMMKTIKCEIRFLTPAFLGNAGQSGQWRTPPFKALLRQWWRVAWVARHGSVGGTEEMREEEGTLFGNADPDTKKSCKSKVQLRLEEWSDGKLTNEEWPRTGGRPAGGRGFDPMRYVGYGLLKNAGEMEQNRVPAIDCGDSRVLRIAVTDVARDDVVAAVSLVGLYGSLGGRSRNGWGSLDITVNGTADSKFPKILRPWREALKSDWAHAIGYDEKGPLIWETGEFQSWNELMKEFGDLRKKIRKKIKAPGGNTRSPNTIRFKARAAENSGRLRGVIFHMPCKPPHGIGTETGSADWEEAHTELDLDKSLSRSRE